MSELDLMAPARTAPPATAPEAAPVLEVEGLRKTYRLPRRSLFAPAPRNEALKGADFVLRPGETLGVVGESGSGKSTLARLCMGFETPDAGAARLFGQDLSKLSQGALAALRPRFQMVFQDPVGSLDPRRKAGWSVAEPLLAQGVGREERRARAREALVQVGLSAEDDGKFPHEFSGGQRQRLAIARAIVTRPALIVADEPVSALDVSVQAQVLNLLMDLQEEMGLAMLFISHDLGVVGAISDQLLVMRRGEVVERGPAETLLSRPEHPYTAALLRAAG